MWASAAETRAWLEGQCGWKEEASRLCPAALSQLHHQKSRLCIWAPSRGLACYVSVLGLPQPITTKRGLEAAETLTVLGAGDEGLQGQTQRPRGGLFQLLVAQVFLGWWPHPCSLCLPSPAPCLPSLSPIRTLVTGLRAYQEPWDDLPVLGSLSIKTPFNFLKNF